MPDTDEVLKKKKRGALSPIHQLLQPGPVAFNMKLVTMLTQCSSPLQLGSSSLNFIFSNFRGVLGVTRSLGHLQVPLVRDLNISSHLSRFVSCLSRKGLAGTIAVAFVQSRGWGSSPALFPEAQNSTDNLLQIDEEPKVMHK